MDGVAAKAGPVRLTIVGIADVTPAVGSDVKLSSCGRDASRDPGRGGAGKEAHEKFWEPGAGLGLGGSTLEAVAGRGGTYAVGVIAICLAYSAKPFASCCSNSVPLALLLGVLAVVKLPGREAPEVIAPPGRAAVAAAPAVFSRAAVAAATAASAAANAPWDSIGPVGLVGGWGTPPWVSGRPMVRVRSGLSRLVFAGGAACSGKSECCSG